jgi:hypothetical protein
VLRGDSPETRERSFSGLVADLVTAREQLLLTLWRGRQRAQQVAESVQDERPFRRRWRRADDPGERNTRFVSCLY